MEPKDWIALTGIIATACTAAMTMLLAQWRERHQQSRDDRLRDEARLREERLRAAQRVLVPRAQVELECRFLGPDDGRYVTEVRINVENIGTVRRTFEHMHIRLLGIRSGQSLERWDERDPSRLKFPEVLAKADLVPAGEHYYFVEPGVRQTLHIHYRHSC